MAKLGVPFSSAFRMPTINIGAGAMNLRALTAMSGAGAIAAIVQAASLVLVARLSTPEIIGSYALWLAVSSIAGVLLSARADSLVLAAPSAEDAEDVAANAIHLAFLVCAALMLITFGAQIGGLAGWGLPVAIMGGFLGSRFDIYRGLLVRQDNPKGAALLLISRSLLSSALLVSAAYLTDRFEMLLLANFASFLLVPTVKSDPQKVGPDLSSCIMHFRKYKSQYLFGAPSAIISTFYLQGLPIVFSAAFGASVAGAIFLVVRAIQLPVGLLARATSELVTAAISGSTNQRQARLRAERFLGVVSISLLFASVAFYFVDVGGIVVLVLGSAWLATDFSIGPAFALMLAFAAVQFFVSPLMTDFIRFGRQKIVLLWEVGRAGLLLGGVVGLSAYGANIAFAYWAVVGMFSYGLLHSLRRRVLVQEQVEE